MNMREKPREWYFKFGEPFMRSLLGTEAVGEGYEIQKST